MRHSARLVAIPLVLFALTALLCWLVLFDAVRGALSVAGMLNANAQEADPAALQEAAGALAAGEGGAVHAAFPLWGQVIGTIDVASAGIHADILQGDGLDLLGKGAGHSFATALPGEDGRVVLSAHNNLHFSTLGAVQPGDEVVLACAWGTYRYRASETFTFDEADSNVLAGMDGELLLYTCYPFDQLGTTPTRYGVLCVLEEGPAVVWE